MVLGMREKPVLLTTACVFTTWGWLPGQMVSVGVICFFRFTLHRNSLAMFIQAPVALRANMLWEWERCFRKMALNEQPSLRSRSSQRQEAGERGGFLMSCSCAPPGECVQTLIAESSPQVF